MTEPSLLKVENLSVVFNLASSKVLALSHVNLSVQQSQIVVLAGETGSGKSTLGKIVLGLADDRAEIDPRSKIFFQGEEVSNFKNLRGKDIGLISQNPVLALNPVRRCGSQILEVVKKFLPNLNRKGRKSYIYQLLEDCELEDLDRVYDAYPHQLSLGQLQRVSIAMAIAPKPKVLIADEPFSSLDLVTKDSLVKIMLGLHKIHPFAMLLITHDLGLIRAMADRWYVLKGGFIRGFGTGDFLKMKHEDPYLKALQTNHLKLDETASSVELDEKNILQTNALSFHYLSTGWRHRKRDKSALTKSTFAIRKGEIFGIVGRSGSGKSTLAKIMGGLHPSYEGSIKFWGKELREILVEDQRRYFRQVQYILQDAGSSLPPRLKMERVMRMTLRAFYPDMSDADIKGRKLELMQSVALDPVLLERYRHQLSGGEQQRMCIARALCADPQVIIMDESLTDLDQNIQAEVIQLLFYLNQKQNLTIILVAHDLRLIRYCSHRLLVLNNGLIDSYGSWEQVSSAGKSDYLNKLLSSM